eukprot:NODE_238_length_2234_cov_12.321310_g232_i0.p1 GENE.NODE_238_length_2234_cov_12.321310_g232_i0~~NODE_238_length_2234_cov_12.321310_g232_i0.p1  ORF type:complete len:724 (-),score=109.36 NODE_238_length_2234_cov_12.321310_g232_i0:62-1948(-)
MADTKLSIHAPSFQPPQQNDAARTKLQQQVAAQNKRLQESMQASLMHGAPPMPPRGGPIHGVPDVHVGPTPGLVKIEVGPTPPIPALGGLQAAADAPTLNALPLGPNGEVPPMNRFVAAAASQKLAAETAAKLHTMQPPMHEDSERAANLWTTGTEEVMEGARGVAAEPEADLDLDEFAQLDGEMPFNDDNVSLNSSDDEGDVPAIKTRHQTLAPHAQKTKPRTAVSQAQPGISSQFKGLQVETLGAGVRGEGARTLNPDGIAVADDRTGSSADGSPKAAKPRSAPCHPPHPVTGTPPVAPPQTAAAVVQQPSSPSDGGSPLPQPPRLLPRVLVPQTAQAILPQLRATGPSSAPAVAPQAASSPPQHPTYSDVDFNNALAVIADILGPDTAPADPIPSNHVPLMNAGTAPAVVEVGDFGPFPELSPSELPVPLPTGSAPGSAGVLPSTAPNLPEDDAYFSAVLASSGAYPPDDLSAMPPQQQGSAPPQPATQSQAYATPKGTLYPNTFPPPPGAQRRRKTQQIDSPGVPFTAGTAARPSTQPTGFVPSSEAAQDDELGLAVRIEGQSGMQVITFSAAATMSYIRTKVPYDRPFHFIVGGQAVPQNQEETMLASEAMMSGITTVKANTP